MAAETLDGQLQMAPCSHRDLVFHSIGVISRVCVLQSYVADVAQAIIQHLLQFWSSSTLNQITLLVNHYFIHFHFLSHISSQHTLKPSPFVMLFVVTITYVDIVLSN